MSGAVRRHLVVSGRVQDVWFRDSCQREAHRLRVSGWVRNRNDGAVEIEAEGDAPAVAELESWAGRGPSNAQVVHVEATDADPEGRTRFEVR